MKYAMKQGVNILDILNDIEEDAIKFSSASDRFKKKAIGQFFTPKDIAKYMASLVEIEYKEVSILDPGAGSGILSCALLYELLNNREVFKVHVDLYEIDKEVLPLLENSFSRMKNIYEENGKSLVYNIKNKDFIIENSSKWEDKSFEGIYDIVIANPPYKKLRKKDRESMLMSSIIYGQPNIYFLFMAIAIKLLKENGQFVFLTPRSYFCGAYFIKFREWFICNNNIEKISMFDSRKTVFLKEQVLQETVILKGRKSKKQNDKIETRRIYDIKLGKISDAILVEKSIALDDTGYYYIKIPSTEEEYDSLKFVHRWTNSLDDLRIKVSTGKVVDFRSKNEIFNDTKITKNTYPLIWDINLKNGVFVWPIKYKKKYQLITSNSKTICNLNYLLIRRITSKEENKRIQIVQYYKEMLETDRIGIENHVNYMYKINGELNQLELLGLFVIFNSSIIDNYFKILCGSTQINATEINTMKLPHAKDIENIGKIAEQIKPLTSDKCNNILLSYFHENT